MSSDDDKIKQLDEHVERCYQNAAWCREQAESCKSDLWHVQKEGYDTSSIRSAIEEHLSDENTWLQNAHRYEAELEVLRVRVAAARAAEQAEATQQRKQRAAEEQVTREALQKAAQLEADGNYTAAIRALESVTNQAGTSGSWACQVRVCELYHRARKPDDVKRTIQHLFRYETADGAVWEKLAALATANYLADEAIQCNRRRLKIRRNDRALLALTVEAAVAHQGQELGRTIVKEIVADAAARQTMLAGLASDLQPQAGSPPQPGLGTLACMLLELAGTDGVELPSQLLLHLWGSRQVRVCLAVLGYLKQRPNPKAVGELVAGFTTLADAPLRAAALSPLADLLGQASGSLLAQAAADGSAAVRQAVVARLRIHPDPAALAILVSTFSEIADPAGRASLVRSLVELLGPNAGDFLERSARDPDWQVKLDILAALEGHPDEPALGWMLAEIAQLEDTKERAALVWPLCQAIGPSAVWLLGKLTADQAAKWHREVQLHFGIRPDIETVPSTLPQPAPSVGTEYDQTAGLAEMRWAFNKWNANTEDARARERYISACEQAGKWWIAIEVLSSSLSRDPANGGLRRRMARTLLRAGRTDEAQSLSRAILEADSGDLEARACLAESLAANGQMDEAMSLWRQALAHNPEAAKAREHLLAILAAAGKQEEELAVLLAGLTCSPNNETWLIRAAELLLAHNREEALIALLSPYSAVATMHEKLARWLLRQGRIGLAVKLWASGELTSAGSELAGRLAQELYMSGQIELADEFVTGMLAAYPGTHDLAVALVPYWLAVLAEPDPARRTLAEDGLRPVLRSVAIPWLVAYSLHTDTDLRQRAVALLHAVDSAAAERVLIHRLLEPGPETRAETAAQLVRMCGSARAAELEERQAGTAEQADDWPEAISFLRFTLDANPGNMAARERLARALQHSGKREDALEVWNAALVFDPQNGEARERLGTLLAELGRYEEELAVWQAGLVYEPSHEQWQMRVAVLLRSWHTDAELLEFVRQYAIGPAYERFMVFLLSSGRAKLAVALWTSGNPSASEGGPAESRAELAARLAGEFYRDGYPQSAEDFVTGLLDVYPSSRKLASAMQGFWLTMLADADPERRARAEKRLQAVANAVTVPGLMEAANGTDLDVRKRAIRVLHHIAPEEVRRVLGRQLVGETRVGKLAALEMLTDLYGSGCVAQLEGRLGTETDQAVCEALIVTLRQLDPRPRSLLETLGGQRRWAA